MVDNTFFGFVIIYSLAQCQLELDFDLHERELEILNFGEQLTLVGRVINVLPVLSLLFDFLVFLFEVLFECNDHFDGLVFSLCLLSAHFFLHELQLIGTSLGKRDH